MSKTKLIFGLVILLALLIGFVYFFISSTPPIYNVKVLILNNDYLKIDTITNNISEKLAELLSSNKPVQLNFSYITTTRIFKPNYELKIKPGEELQRWKLRIKNYLKETLNDTVVVVLEDNKVNDLFEKFLKDAISTKDLKNTFFVVIGTFPECYEYSSKKALINSTKEILRSSKLSKKINLLTALVDPRKNIEQEIFDSLLVTNKVSIQHLDVDLEKERKCYKKNLPLVFGMFFNKLSNFDSQNLLEYIKLTAGTNFFLTIWNDGPKNGAQIIYLNQAGDSAEFNTNVVSLAKCNWSSLNFLFKQAYHNLSTLPDTVHKYLYFVGNFPEAGEQNLLGQEFWSNFAKIKNLHLFHFLAKGQNIGYEKNIFKALKKYHNLSISTSY